MKRVHVICEGQTEEMFVNEVLSPHFSAKSIYLSAIIIGKPGHKGGNIRLERLIAHIKQILLHDKSAYCTTFFDYYGLPADFPGYSRADAFPNNAAKAAGVTEALVQNLQKEIPENTIRRFIPYVQMHEFEALLFSDSDAIRHNLRISIPDAFDQIRNIFPEEINDSPQTAPSKRISTLVPGYQKVLYGTLIAKAIGLPQIRISCPLFNNWITTLENLTGAPS